MHTLVETIKDMHLSYKNKYLHIAKAGFEAKPGAASCAARNFTRRWPSNSGTCNSTRVTP